MAKKWLSHKGLVYAATPCGTRLINNVFQFYYVKVFLDRYHMSQMWFQISQIIFAVWNAVNDPWFGYIQDKATSGWLSSRRKCILYCALPWVISSLLPWFAWADYSDGSNQVICFLQGLISLCLFDTFFTFCLLAHCALMTEYGETDEQRLLMIRYAGVAGIIGSSSVFFTDYFSSGLQNYRAFQCVCILLALLALAAFCYTGFYATTKYDEEYDEVKDLPVEMSKGSYWSLTKDIFRNKNFRLFVAMNFLQELHITYVLNFAKIFSDQMIPPDAVSVENRSLLLGSLVILPQILVVAASPIVSRVGVVNIELASFAIKIVMGFIMYISAAAHSVWFLIFLIIDFSLSDGAFTFFVINLSDIADEDQTLHGRKKPIASMVFGSNALVVKPALSLSPMVVAGILNRFGYESVTSGKASSEEKAELQHVIFLFSCFAPVVIGILQLLIWRNYSLIKEKTAIPISQRFSMV